MKSKKLNETMKYPVQAIKNVEKKCISFINKEDRNDDHFILLIISLERRCVEQIKRKTKK